jgi:hypothetical protein
MKSILVVPVDLEVLCVGDNANDKKALFTPADADFSLTSSNPNGDNLFLSENGINAGAFASPSPRDSGIYLHWALPDGLTNAKQNETTGEIDFPTVPNRWLVVRTYTDISNPSQPKNQSKSWIIESDVLSETQQNIGQKNATVPVDIEGPNQQAYNYLGKITPVSTQWNESNPTNYMTTFTVLGYGEPTYAAYHPNCPNVFSMHDSLNGVPATDVSYAVVGWFSDSKNDPINVAEWTTKKWNNLSNPYNWKWNTAANDLLPNASIYQGIFTAITWDPTQSYNNLDVNISSSTTVVVANSSIEAISAYIAQNYTEAGYPAEKVEQLLNALQIGALEKINQPGGAAEAEERIHAKQFSTLSAGSLWELKPVSGSDDKVSNESYTPGIATALNRLNISEQAKQEAEEQLISLKKQLFFDWNKYMNIKYENSGTNQGQGYSIWASNEIKSYLMAQIDAITTASTNGDTCTATVTKNLTLLKGLIPKELMAVPVAAPRYYQPNDPAVLMFSDHMSLSDRYGGDGKHNEDGTLQCRLNTNLTTELNFNAGIASASPVGKLTVAEMALLIPINFSNVTQAPEILQAALELYFLDPAKSNLLASIICEQAGQTTGNLAAFEKSIHSAMTNFVAGKSMTSSSITFDGTLPSPISLNSWTGKNPWIPIAMDWDVSFTPSEPVITNANLTGSSAAPFAKINSNTNYAPDIVLNNYPLDKNQIDLQRNFKTNPQSKTTQQEYKNSILLSNHATLDLCDVLKKYIKVHQSDPAAEAYVTLMKELLPKIQNLKVASQALSGFNNALLMQHLTMQLQINDGGAEHLAWRFSNVEVAKAVGDQNIASPLINNYYNPIRAGLLDFNKIRIVDTFGSYRCVNFTKPIQSSPCANSDGSWTAPKLLIASHMQALNTVNPSVALTARITQPARLMFRFLSAENNLVEMNSHPASTPICGWILFNHLDNSLVFYNTAGTMIGSLYSVEEGQSIKFIGAPGSADFESDISTAFTDQNTHLSNLALQTFANGATYLQNLLQQINDSVGLIEPNLPKESPGLALLFGRPLAVVRSKMYLDLQGYPAWDQSYGAFVNDGDLNSSSNPTYKITNRSDNGFTQVQFPVRLGDLSKMDDGLVGYFKTAGIKDTEADYKTYYSGASTSGNTQNTLTANGKPQYLTIIADVRAKIHATSGTLPVKSLQIPPEMYQQALDNIAVNFLTAPILQKGNGLNIPIPAVTEGKWNWLNKIGKTSKPTPANWSVQALSGKPAAAYSANYSPQSILEGYLQWTNEETKTK